MGEPPLVGGGIPVRRGVSGWWVVLSAWGMMAVLAVIYWFPPGDYGFYPRCGLYAWTGLHCPGCGSLRAVHHLTHGRVLAAAGSNALLVLGLGVAVGFGVMRWLGWKSEMLSGWGCGRWLLVGCAVALCFGVLRNLPWAPFVYLAP
ncbi:MAG: hypothetical protein RI897_3330 [Verrucomicrobiota bacterium]